MIIAIDGPAGSGKSTIAKKLSEKLDFYLLNSGNFYRAFTFKHLKKGRDPFNAGECLRTAEESRIEIKDGQMYLDGNLVTEEELHNPSIDIATSRLSFVPEVREIVNRQLREAASRMNVVCEGRDITTVVFPNADLKFYIDADPEIRARRRLIQSGKDETLYGEILSDLKKRDKQDIEKPVGGLKIAPDAHVIDTTHLTIDQVCEKVMVFYNTRANR